MKHKLVILILIIQNSVLAQKKIYLEYNVKKDNIVTTEFLISDTNNTLYTTSFIDFYNKKSLLNETKDGNFKVEQKNIKINKMMYYTSYSSNNLYFISIFPKNSKKIIALDSLPKPKWIIFKKESKKINNFQCYKATTIFRGSKITAYYTPEIPIGSGPFKLKGLPGLILEAYNTDIIGSKYYWKVKKLIYPFETKINLKFNHKKYQKNIVTYKSIIQKFDRKMTLVSKKMASYAPRGSSTKLTKTTRLGIEKNYEWEKETTQN